MNNCETDVILSSDETDKNLNNYQSYYRAKFSGPGAI